MTDRSLRWVVGVAALVGAAIATYLVWARSTGSELICTTGGCETVQSSSYAEVLGVPVAVLGLLGYVLIGATALLASPEARAAGAALALTAVAFSGYLLVVQLAIIDALCLWCVANDAVAAVGAAAAVLRVRHDLRPAAT